MVLLHSLLHLACFSGLVASLVSLPYLLQVSPLCNASTLSYQCSLYTDSFSVSSFVTLAAGPWFSEMLLEQLPAGFAFHWSQSNRGAFVVSR